MGDRLSGSAPVPIVSRPIGVELRLTETSTVGKKWAWRVADCLEGSLGVDVVVDVWLEGLIAEEEVVDDIPESEGRVASPGVEVCVCVRARVRVSESSWNFKRSSWQTVRVSLKRTGDDEAASGSSNFGAIGANIVEDSLQGNCSF